MIQKEEILKEAWYKAVKSSGSGGQHVNKVATCVQLFFNLDESKLLDEGQRLKIKKHLKNKISHEGILMVECGESRSQAKNKQLVSEKFFALIIESFREKKKRIKTHTPARVKEKRLKDKKERSKIKAERNFRTDHG